MSNSSQSSASVCKYPAAQGGSLQNQFKSLVASTKKTVKGVKRKVIGKKKPVKRKSTTTKKKPAKRKTPVKKKSTVAKKKSTVAKRKPAKRKPAKRKSAKGGGPTSIPRAFVSTLPNTTNRGGGNFNTAQGADLNKKTLLLGGGSSDFISTVASRGPVNYPQGQGTGLGGEQLFRTFNKTGLYMPTTTMNCDSVLMDGILNTKLAGC